MDSYFESFKEEIESALAQVSDNEELADQTRLVFLGRIGFAVEQGRLTLPEVRKLDDRLGGARTKFGEALELAGGGTLPETERPVAASPPKSQS